MTKQVSPLRQRMIDDMKIRNMSRDDVGQGHATKLQHYLLVPVTYGLALTFFLGTYYGAHAALFGTTIF